jgi:hypothetical protein
MSNSPHLFKPSELRKIFLKILENYTKKNINSQKTNSEIFLNTEI